MVPKIHLLDGGTLYEINKKYNDLGETCINDNPEYVTNIHQNYINIGCRYITTSNYGFKSLKFNNWKDLVLKSCLVTKNLKKRHNTKILGCLPPYFESYNNGKVNREFINFYNNLIDIMDNYVDKYIIETCVSMSHVVTILDILEKRTSKDVFFSIYPRGNITKNDIMFLIQLRYKNLKGILINCCNFNDMVNYYNTHIKSLDISRYIFGFYCNSIDEKKYTKMDNSLKNKVSLQDFKNNDKIEINTLQDFLCNYKSTSTIIIGGCCGYGVDEMRELINLIVTVYN